MFSLQHYSSNFICMFLKNFKTLKPWRHQFVEIWSSRNSISTIKLIPTLKAYFLLKVLRNKFPFFTRRNNRIPQTIIIAIRGSLNSERYFWRKPKRKPRLSSNKLISILAACNWALVIQQTEGEKTYRLAFSDQRGIQKAKLGINSCHHNVF